jgi:NAD(P)-dependent dehydrogenase (short-subunit alcohol dehydrogenase family)
MDMQEQTVVVTGGASGIGKATAFLLARQGARVLIGDIDEAGGRATATEGLAERLAIDYLPLDLADKPSIDNFVAAVHQRVACVDGLVNGPDGIRSSPFSKIPRKCGTASSPST